MKRFIAISVIGLLYFASAGPASGQVPGTDIFVAPLMLSASGIEVGEVKNATNRPGYDNQPSFTPNGNAFLYTVIGPDGQAETFRYDLSANAVLRLTFTSESEYSPTVMPGGQTFSVVRVETDSTQRLWKFDLDGSNPSLLIGDVFPVGYHAWADAKTVALFVLGQPSTLHLTNVATGQDEILASNIGRSLHKIPGARAISFLHRTGEDEAWISALDLTSGDITRIAPGLPENEFYTWTPDGSLLTARGTVLYRWRPDVSEAWERAHDFGNDVSGGLSRLAVSPDGRWLAVVASEPSAP